MQLTKSQSLVTKPESVSATYGSFLSRFELMCMGMCRMLSVPVRLPVLAKPWR